jgi:hypothetical protein
MLCDYPSQKGFLTSGTVLTTAAIPPAYLSSPRFHLDGGLMMRTLSPLNMIKFELPMEIEVKDGAGGLCLISTIRVNNFHLNRRLRRLRYLPGLY